MTNPCPTQADIYRIFQSYIWNDAGLPHYRTFKNAHIAVTIMGAKPTPAAPSGEPFWAEFLFPDGSLVEILSNGSAINDPAAGCGGIYNQLYEGGTDEDEYDPA